MVAPAFLRVDQSKLSTEGSASSPLGRVSSCGNAFQSCWEFKPKEHQGTLRTFLSVKEGWAWPVPFSPGQQHAGPVGLTASQWSRPATQSLQESCSKLWMTNEGGPRQQCEFEPRPVDQDGILGDNVGGRPQRSSTTQ